MNRNHRGTRVVVTAALVGASLLVPISFSTGASAAGGSKDFNAQVLKDYQAFVKVCAPKSKVNKSYHTANSGGPGGETISCLSKSVLTDMALVDAPTIGSKALKSIATSLSQLSYEYQAYEKAYVKVEKIDPKFGKFKFAQGSDIPYLVGKNWFLIVIGGVSQSDQGLPSAAYLNTLGTSTRAILRGFQQRIGGTILTAVPKAPSTPPTTTTTLATTTTVPATTTTTMPATTTSTSTTTTSTSTTTTTVP